MGTYTIADMLFAKRLYCSLFWIVILLENYRVEGAPWWRAMTPEELMVKAKEDFDKGDYEGARYEANLAIETSKTPKAEHHEMVGKCFLETNKAHLAIDSFTEALKITPDNEEIRVMLAEALFTLERFPEAVDHILSANDTNLVHMGNKLYAREEFEHVIRCYDEMIERHPDNAEYHKLRGKCHVETKTFDKAISDFQAALLLQNSKDEDSLLQLSRVLFHSGKFHEILTGMLAGLGNEFYAAEEYENALKCYDALVVSVKMCTEIGHKSFQFYRRPYVLITVKKPELAEVYGKRALCFWKIDRLQDAIVDFEKMIQLPGHQLPYRIDFAEVLHEVGKDDYAERVLQDLNEKNLWDEEYIRLRKVLQKIQGNIEIENEDSDEIQAVI